MISKLFLVILSGGIMLTACKKENNEMPAKHDQLHSWKTSDWIMTKNAIVVEGTLCDEYQNQLTGQLVYEAKEESKAVNWNKKAIKNGEGKVDCKDAGSNCVKTVISGEDVIILKPGTKL
ncbi:MAG: hypothetical protein Fur0028_05710 [Bacteroidales bacterium]